MWVRTLTTIALITAPAAAQVAPTPAPGFSVKADGNWEMICHVLVDGDQVNVVLNSRRSSYANQHLVRASCESTGHAQGDTVISIVGSEKCPFKGVTEEVCTMTSPRGRPIAFEFRSRKAR